MSVVLVRVDDRLVHGQVVEGWLRVIQAERVIVASDRAASDPWQAGLMRLALPEGVRLDVAAVGNAGAVIADAAQSPARALVLVASVGDARRLVEAGAPITEINLGGVHDGPGRAAIGPNLYLSDAEKADVLALRRRGLRVEARALPTDEPTSLEGLETPAAASEGR